MAASPQDKAPPTLAAVVVATAIVAGLTGYYIGQARSIGLFGSSSSKHSSSKAEEDPKHGDGDVESSDMSDASSGGGDELGELESFAEHSEECKLVLVVRTDLGMTKGKRGHVFLITLELPAISQHFIKSLPAVHAALLRPTCS
jgi:hypothetical protein